MARGALAALWLCASVARAAPPRLEQVAAANAGIDLIVALPSPSVAGNTLIVALAAGTAGPNCSVSDTAGNAWSFASVPFVGTAGLMSSKVQLAYAKNIVVNPEPIEVTVACNQPEARVLEYSGLDPLNPFDGVVAATGQGAIDSGVLVTNASNALLLGWVFAQTTVTSIDSAFTPRTQFDGDWVGDRVVNATGAWSFSGFAPSSAWASQLAAFTADTTLGGGAVRGLADGGPGAGFVFVQSASAASENKGPVQTALPAPSQVGNTLIACVISDSPTCPIAGENGDAWVVASGPTRGQGNLSGSYQQLAYSRVMTASPRPVEVSLGCTTPVELIVAEYAGLGALDVTSVGLSSMSMAIDSGAVTTSAANELLLACVHSALLVQTVGGFTQRAPFNGNALADAVAATPGSYAATGTTNSLHWIASIAAFRGMPDAGVPDAGVAPADAGTPPPSPTPRALSAGCGCSAADSGLGLALLVLGLVRRSRAAASRHTARPASIEPEPPARKSKQEQEQDRTWEAQALQLKADGYNSGVVARKMIQVHGMPDDEAEALVGRVFGKKVNARAGDTTGNVVLGLAMVAGGLGGAGLLFMIVGLAFLKLTFMVYLALFGVAAKGAQQAIIAMVNADVKETLKK